MLINIIRWKGCNMSICQSKLCWIKFYCIKFVCRNLNSTPDHPSQQKRPYYDLEMQIAHSHHPCDAYEPAKGFPFDCPRTERYRYYQHWLGYQSWNQIIIICIKEPSKKAHYKPMPQREIIETPIQQLALKKRMSMLTWVKAMTICRVQLHYLILQVQLLSCKSHELFQDPSILLTWNCHIIVKDWRYTTWCHVYYLELTVSKTTSV